MAATRLGQSTKSTASGIIQGGQGAALVAATSLAITDFLHEVSGSATITTITGGKANSILTLVPASGSTWSLGTGGNISQAISAVAGVPITLLYDGASWRPISVSAGDLPYIDVTQAPYNADPTGVVDAGASITLAAAALSAQGGGTLVFPPGTYNLFSVAGGFLSGFSGLNGVRILGYGATLAVSTTNPDILTSAGYGVIFYFTNTKNILIDGFNVTGPDIPSTFAGGGSKGINVCQFEDGCENIEIPNLRAQGVQAALLFPNTSLTAMAPNRHIRVGNLTVSDSYYGFSGRFGLYNVKIANLRTDTIYRSLFCYGGVYDLDATVHSKDNANNDVMMYSSTDGTSTAGLENIHVKYIRGTESQNVGAGGRCIYWGWNSENPATLRNITFDLDVAHASSGNTGPGVMMIIKNTNAGAADTADRGHKLYNLTIRGTVTGSPSAPAGSCITTDSATNWGASSDGWYGIALRDLNLGVTALSLDCAAIRDHIVLDNVSTTSVIYLIDQVDGLRVSKTAKIYLNGVSCANLHALSGDARPLATRTEFTSNPYSVPASYFYGGVAMDNRAFGSTNTYALPASVVGMECVFTNVKGAGINFRLAPDGTEVIDNGGTAGGAGKYLQLSPGASARLKCFTAGTWRVIHANGTLAFEP